MAGGTLVVSKNVNGFPYYKKRLEEFGFANVITTDVENEGLKFIIREMKPDIILIGACFYKKATAYMLGELLRVIPGLNIAVVSYEEYSDELAMCMVANGVNSYVRWFDGYDEFIKGMTAVRDGIRYISPAVRKRRGLRDAKLTPAGRLFKRQKEVMRLTCSGFKEDEVADTLLISRDTVVKHRTNIFKIMNVRNPVELLLNVLESKTFTLNELYSIHKNFVVTPLPAKDKRVSNRWKRREANVNQN
jgi:DNA-binding NarL/FixJ family response regulator